MSYVSGLGALTKIWKYYGKYWDLYSLFWILIKKKTELGELQRVLLLVTTLVFEEDKDTEMVFWRWAKKPITLMMHIINCKGKWLDSDLGCV